MRLISPLLKRAVYPTLHRAGWLDHVTAPGGFAVVTYHGVLPAGYRSDEPFLDGNLIRAAVFRQQLQFLQSRYRIIAPEDFLEFLEQRKAPSPRSILITCDDGLLNTLTDMLPILQEERIPCLFFVTAASCDKTPAMLWHEELYRFMRRHPLTEEALRLLPESRPPSSRTFQAQWWAIVERASQLHAEERNEWMTLLRPQSGAAPAGDERRWRLLDFDELKQLAAAGMTIGGHTHTHPILSLCSDEEVRREIRESKYHIERALGRKVWAFAYPYGNPVTIGDREFRFAEQAGYSCAFLNVEHWNDRESNSFAIPRIHVNSDMTLPEFAAHVSGFHTWLRRAWRRGVILSRYVVAQRSA
jgi:peptidoglycan/xylan/chitin deacetylase (PgdA/CDA1 family)